MEPINVSSELTKATVPQQMEILEKSLENGPAREADCNGTKRPHDDRSQIIDMALVDRVRELIDALWLNAETHTQYSEQHYEEIMDPTSAHTCWRYLTQCNLKIEEAVKLIESALVWRKQNGVEESMNKQFVKEFWFHSPMFFCGADKKGNEVIYMIGRHYRKPDSKLAPIIRKYCLNVLFNWERQHRYDLEQVSFVFDTSNTGYQNFDLEFMSWFVRMRTYLPSRISDIYVVGIPLLMRPLVKLIVSWLPENISKLVHCGTIQELVVANIEMDNMPEELGGTKPESFYRLAPIETPWARGSALLAENNMLKYMENSIWFHVTDERKQRLQAIQENYETNKASE